MDAAVNIFESMTQHSLKIFPVVPGGLAVVRCSHSEVEDRLFSYQLAVYTLRF